MAVPGLPGRNYRAKKWQCPACLEVTSRANNDVTSPPSTAGPQSRLKAGEWQQAGQRAKRQKVTVLDFSGRNYRSRSDSSRLAWKRLPARKRRRLSCPFPRLNSRRRGREGTIECGSDIRFRKTCGKTGPEALHFIGRSLTPLPLTAPRHGEERSK